MQSCNKTKVSYANLSKSFMYNLIYIYTPWYILWIVSVSKPCFDCKDRAFEQVSRAFHKNTQWQLNEWWHHIQHSLQLFHIRSLAKTASLALFLSIQLGLILQWWDLYSVHIEFDNSLFQLGTYSSLHELVALLHTVNKYVRTQKEEDWQCQYYILCENMCECMCT